MSSFPVCEGYFVPNTGFLVFENRHRDFSDAIQRKTIVVSGCIVNRMVSVYCIILYFKEHTLLGITINNKLFYNFINRL